MLAAEEEEEEEVVWAADTLVVEAAKNATR